MFRDLGPCAAEAKARLSGLSQGAAGWSKINVFLSSIIHEGKKEVRSAWVGGSGVGGGQGRWRAEPEA